MSSGLVKRTMGFLLGWTALDVVFAAAAILTAAISVFVPPDRQGLRVGAFGASVVPVAVRQVRGYGALARRRDEALAAIRQTDQNLKRAAHGLGRLRRANVCL